MNKDEKRQARILALQTFFSFEQQNFNVDIKTIFDEVIKFGDIDEEQDTEKFRDENGEIKEILKIKADNPADLSENAKKYAFEIVKFSAKNLKKIDSKLLEYIKDWSFERISAIDRNLLRIAFAEMDEKFGVPTKVVINEAIEIAKIFGTDESAKFVNAILDKIKKTGVKT
jgi:N utilization substance protein B